MEGMKIKHADLLKIGELLRYLGDMVEGVHDEPPADRAFHLDQIGCYIAEGVIDAGFVGKLLDHSAAMGAVGNCIKEVARIISD